MKLEKHGVVPAGEWGLDARIVDASPDFISIIDRTYRYIRVNQAYERAHGKPRTELIGRTVGEIFGEGIFKTRIKPRLDACLAGEQVLEDDWFPFAAIGRRFVSVSMTPMTGSEGTVDSVLLVGRDVTERHLAMEAEAAANRRLQQLFDDAGDGILLIDLASLRFVAVNRAAARHLGYTPEDMVGMSLKDINPPRVHGRTTAMIERLTSGEAVVFENLHLCKDGREVPVEISARVIETETGRRVIQSFVRDISERKENQEKLAMFRRFAEASGQGFGMADLEGRVTYANPAMARFCGLPSPAQFVGRSVSDFYQGADLRRLSEEVMPTVFAEGQWTGELTLTADDGATLTAIHNLFAIRDAEGSPIHLAGLVTDITDRKRLEAVERLARREAESASRAKSEFLATMSHELRTPLNAVIGFADAMLEQTFGPLDNPRYREYVGLIQDSGRHLLDLINDILDVSVIEVGGLDLSEEVFDIDAVARTAMRLVQPRADGAGVFLQEDLADDLPTLRADLRRVRQVLLNLLTNAVKFTPSGGTVRLEVARAGDGALVVAVEDTGIGMNAEDLHVALQPFGQVDRGLARRHEGTGLGLPLSKALVEAMGGRLDIASRPGKGTRAEIHFPPSRVDAHPPS